MSPLQRVRKTLGILGLAVAVPTFALAQSGYQPQGAEFFPSGMLPGDQINPSASVTTNGGYVVWQDNTADGDGFGIMALRLDGSFSPAQSSFRVNQAAADDQENPQVAVLQNGGAAVVWQGGKQSFQHIYARFLSSSNTFVTSDVLVSTNTSHFQQDANLATLANGNVLITWASFGQDNADGLQGVYARLFSPVGVPLTAELPVNQFTSWNQRTPAVAALAGGNFVVAWVSEQQSYVGSVGIYARLFNAGGTPLGGGEFAVNTGTNVCANPAVAAASDGTFAIAWCEKDLVVRNNSWDVFARSFSSGGAGGVARRVNTQLYGDQYRPRLSASGTDYLAAWTSMGQDGSREGVFGQYLRGDVSAAGSEFRINTTILNQQLFQSVASDGAGRFLVVWSSYNGAYSMDLAAQRYATYLAPLSAPGAPVVTALDSYSLSVTWSPLGGFSVDHWELYEDGSAAPYLLTNTFWQNDVNTDLYNPASTHSFQLVYVLSDGRHSPMSTAASGTTWGPDLNHDGLPDNWQTMYWGTNKLTWQAAAAHLGGPNGPTVLQVFEWGANPLDPSTWLVQSITVGQQGLTLNWNTHPGYIYQVITSSNLTDWTNLGGPRYAADVTDSLFLGPPGAAGSQYQIMRLVQ